ncbi:MAG TPA: hypothetical protein VGM69_01110 [Chloroflexota bacterium]
MVVQVGAGVTVGNAGAVVPAVVDWRACTASVRAALVGVGVWVGEAASAPSAGARASTTPRARHAGVRRRGTVASLLFVSLADKLASR